MHNDKTLIHLLVDNAYIEQLMQELPKDKVVVVEESFKENKKLFEAEVQNYKSNNLKTKDYYESMKDLDSWLE
ncbi:MAG: hypothetical protein GXO30_02975 [Epsilonproteobacteria bacterium]|nr:hypothetical protein [Campylobacterota bacterium]